MSEPRYISPMLDGFSLGQAISDHSGVACYPAMRNDSEKRYIVKKISLPASQVQVEALLLTGVYRDTQAVHAYYRELAQGVAEEARILDQLAGQRGFVPYQSCQIEPMEDGVGYEVYLLSRYRKTLDRYTNRNTMTHLGALNLGIDMCAALAVSREAGWLYVDLKPENIFLFGDQEYRLGDLGFVAMDSLEYASLPDRYRSLYTAPEVADAYSSLNATMDTYALGLVLYQIYNEGKLPFDSAETRSDWLERLAAGEVMDAPRCADAEMAGIIAKACAYDPADRWQTPAEMGHALISYMQRNGADDIPIVPPAADPEPEAEEIPAEDTESVEETAEDSIEITESVEESPAESEETADEVEESAAEPVSEEHAVEEPSAEEPVSAEEVEETAESDIAKEASGEESAAEESSGDWIDLMDSFLAEEKPAEDAVEGEAEPSLRELLGDTDQVLAEVPEVSDDDATADAADILTAANELIEHEAPAPVIAPEPIDVPIPEPIALEPEEQEEPEPAQESEKSDATEESSETETPAAEEPAAGPGPWKKILRIVTSLALTAGLLWGAWYYYQNIFLLPIDSMTYDGSATQVTVTVSTAIDQSKLTVICKDTYGNAVKGTLDNGVVTFSDLVPGSQYFISLEPVGFHKLTGTSSVTYSTPAETKIINLTAITGQEAGSAIVSFGVEGTDSDQWILTCTTEGSEPVVVTFSGHTVSIPGLNIGAGYTFTLSTESDVLLVGETSISHIASDLIQAQNLALSDYRSGQMTLSWSAPSGVTVDRWMVRCYNAEGYDQLQEVTETQAVFQGIADGGTYTVEVTAANMTLAVRGDFTADSNNITGFAAVQNGSSISLSWNYAGPVPEGGWKILWSADGGDKQVLTANDSQATLSPAVPGSSYSFTIQPPEGSSMTSPTTELSIPASGNFSANLLDNTSIIVTMHDVPTKSDWGYSALKRSKTRDTFSPGGSMALLYTVTKPYRYERVDYETIFAIRDSEGHLVSASSRTRSWNDMWDNGYCTETVSGLPAVPGSYTLTIYIEGGFLAELPFTIK